MVLTGHCADKKPWAAGIETSRNGVDGHVRAEEARSDAKPEQALTFVDCDDVYGSENAKAITPPTKTSTASPAKPAGPNRYLPAPHIMEENDTIAADHLSKSVPNPQKQTTGEPTEVGERALGSKRREAFMSTSSRPSRRKTEHIRLEPKSPQTSKARRASAALDHLHPTVILDAPSKSDNAENLGETGTGAAPTTQDPNETDAIQTKNVVEEEISVPALVAPTDEAQNPPKNPLATFVSTRSTRRKTDTFVAPETEKSSLKRRASAALDTLNLNLPLDSRVSTTASQTFDAATRSPTSTKQAQPAKRRRALRPRHGDNHRRRTDYDATIAHSPAPNPARRASVALDAMRQSSTVIQHPVEDVTNAEINPVEALSIDNIPVERNDADLCAMEVDGTVTNSQAEDRDGGATHLDLSSQIVAADISEDPAESKGDQPADEALIPPGTGSDADHTQDGPDPDNSAVQDQDAAHDPALPSAADKEGLQSSAGANVKPVLDLQESDFALASEPTVHVTTTKVLLNDEDEDMLKKFLIRSKASKAKNAAKIAQRSSLASRRDSDVVKAALSSPRQALETLDVNSPSPQKKRESLSPTLTAKRSKNQKEEQRQETVNFGNQIDDGLGEPDELTEANVDLEEPSIRRSTRSITPKISSSRPAPNTISIRRQGGEAECVALKKTEAQELAILTKANTRRNKGGAVHARIMLMRLKNTLDEEISETDGTVDLNGRVRWNEELVAYYQEEKQKRESLSQSLGTEDDTDLSGSTSRPHAKRTKMLGAANGTPARSKFKDMQLEDDEAAFPDETQTLDITIPVQPPVMAEEPKESQADIIKRNARAAARRIPTPAKPKRESMLPTPKETPAQLPAAEQMNPTKSIPKPKISAAPSTAATMGVPTRATRHAFAKGQNRDILEPDSRGLVLGADVKGKAVPHDTISRHPVLPRRGGALGSRR